MDVQSEPVGQRDQLGWDQCRLFGVDPPDDVVLRGVSVGVFDGQLGLADPAHAVKGQHRQRPGAAAQPSVQVVEQVGSTGEPGVARRDVPHPRNPLAPSFRRVAGRHGARRPPCGGGRVQPRVVRQDRRLEILQTSARVDPEFVDESAAGLLIGVEGFGLPPGPVQAQHQLGLESLVQRMAVHQTT